jgi:hypothetical protein
MINWLVDSVIRGYFNQQTFVCGRGIYKKQYFHILNEYQYTKADVQNKRQKIVPNRIPYLPQPYMTFMSINIEVCIKFPLTKYYLYLFDSSAAALHEKIVCILLKTSSSITPAFNSCDVFILSLCNRDWISSVYFHV